MPTIRFNAIDQAALLERASSGDREAIGELYETTFEAVYAFAIRFAGNHEDAEDITAATFERALRLLPAFHSGAVPVQAWLVRIARNVALEHVRQNGRLSTVRLTEAMADMIPGEMRQSATGGISDALGACHLSPAQRQVVSLRLSGFKLREIAVMAGKAEGTVKALQHAGLRRIREELESDRYVRTS